jgi:hypothetical protein
MHRFYRKPHARFSAENRLIHETIGSSESSETPIESEPSLEDESERRVDGIEDGTSPTELANLRREVSGGSIPLVPAPGNKPEDTPDQKDSDTDTASGEGGRAGPGNADTPSSTGESTSESSEKVEQESFLKELIKMVFELIKSVSEGGLNITDFTLERRVKIIEKQIAQVDLALAGEGLTREQIRALQDRRSILETQKEQMEEQVRQNKREERVESQEDQVQETTEQQSVSPEQTLQRLMQGIKQETISPEQFVEIVGTFIEIATPAQVRIFLEEFNRGLPNLIEDLNPPPSESAIREELEGISRSVNAYLDSRPDSTTERLFVRDLGFVIGTPQ